jgi:hypothetical protein
MKRLIFVMLVFCNLLLSWLLVLLLLCHWPPPVVPFAAHGENVGLHCDHCSRDGHVNAFCYRKKKAQKAQTRRSSHGTGGIGSGGSERSSVGSVTQEILMLLRRLTASTSIGDVGCVTQSFALTCSATAFQSSTLGPPSATSPDTYPWYLDSGASFHDSSICSSFFFTSFLPSLHCSYRDPLFLLLDRALFPLTLFMSLIFLLFLI